NAARSACNLNELEVTLGPLSDAVVDARQSIIYADQSGDAFQRMGNRTTAADALHQSGQHVEAGMLFAEAARMQQEHQRHFDLLYSLQGLLYCDWLLASAERAAWQTLLRGRGVSPVAKPRGQDAPTTICAAVERRAKTTLSWVTPQDWLLDIALDHLT